MKFTAYISAEEMWHLNESKVVEAYNSESLEAVKGIISKRAKHAAHFRHHFGFSRNTRYVFVHDAGYI